MSFPSFGEIIEEEPKFQEFGEIVSEPATGKSLAFAGTRGLIKGLSKLPIPGLTAPGPVPQELGERILREVMPSKGTKAERIVERGSELAPLVALGPEGISAKLLQLGLGTAAGQLAEEGGLGETGQSIAEAVGMAGKDIAQLPKTLLRRGEKVKLPSGITALKATEAKYPKLARITPHQQEQALKKLNVEAVDLTKKTVEKRVPLSKAIQEGFDFGKKHEIEFGKIQHLAEKANPEIDIKPISNLFMDEKKKISGIPKLHPEAKKIQDEMKAFYKKVPGDLSSLIRTYRSNNQKIKNISETEMLKGRQKDYRNFLSDYNKKIAESIKKTLPEDSAFVKMFEEANAGYRKYIQAKQTVDQLKKILHEDSPRATFAKLARDPNAERKLSFAMGKEGAAEVVQIAKDVQKTREAIKNIPVRELSKYESLGLLGIFVPGVGKVFGAALTAQKLGKGAGALYGMFLATPQRRGYYRKVLESLRNQDYSSYIKYAKKLMDDIDISENEED